MRAVILAAGQGIRLRPYTDDRPKCMVSLAGKPLIQHQLDVLEECDVTDVSIVTGYCSDQLEPYGRRRFHNSLYDRTNMVASLICARQQLDGCDDVIVLYGDIVYERRVMDALLGCDAQFSTTIDLDCFELWNLRMEDPLSDMETLKLDENQCIVELGKKPRSLSDVQGQYMGLTKIKKDFCSTVLSIYDSLDSAAKYDGHDFPNMYMTSLLQEIIDAGYSLKAVPVRGGWIEVDTSEDLEKYRGMLDDGQLREYWIPSA